MNPARAAALVFLATLGTWLSPAHAQMYKCQTPDGRTAFQDKPCAGDAKQGVVKTPAAASSPSPAAGQGDPEAGYRAFHQAVIASFDPLGWLTFYTAARRQQINANNQAGARWLASISRGEWPPSYQITGKQPCGGALCLTATGTGKDLFGRPQEMAGTAELVQEGGAWKIRDVSWDKRKPQ